jgi:hypothetical protein
MIFNDRSWSGSLFLLFDLPPVVLLMSLHDLDDADAADSGVKQ